MDDRQLYKDTFAQVRSSLVINEEMFTTKPKRNTLQTITLLAAVLCLIFACGATAVAVNLFGLRDLIINPEATVGSENDQCTVELISIQGYTDSPEAQAAAEWQKFYNSYVPTMELDNDIFAPGTAYVNYGVYDQTMADKLDEITKKYNLRLYTTQTVLFDRENLNEAMGGTFLSGTCTFLWGYCYDDGTLQFEGDCSVDSGTLDFQFRRSQKGTFSDVVLNIGHAAEYEQWQYQTQSGVTVMLALGKQKSMIFADLPECFVCVNGLAGTDGGILYDDLHITKADLELTADCFDWTVCGGTVTPPEDISLIPPEPDQEDIQFPADNFYNAATTFPAYEVERFAGTVRAHILDKNWASLSELLTYPITIGGTTYNTADDFLADDLDSKFSNEEFFQRLEAESCHEMFCNYEGIMLADGLVWVAEVHTDGGSMLKVITLYA